MYFDSHIHTAFSGDADTPVRKQIETAITLGMEELCITDHHDHDSNDDDTDFELDIDRYLVSLENFKELYKKKIRLRIGIEFGQQPHLLDYEREFFTKYSFDFVVGSTHYIRGVDPYHRNFFEDRTEQEAYRDYFTALANNLERFDQYDTAGHLDYVVRYGPNKNRFYDYHSYGDYLDEILRILIRKNKGLECNTAGLRKGLGQPNPSTEVLKRFRELGGEILTLGSDAHFSKDVGYAFDSIGDLLKNCGYRYYATFAGRRAIFHRL